MLATDLGSWKIVQSFSESEISSHENNCEDAAQHLLPAGANHACLNVDISKALSLKYVNRVMKQLMGYRIIRGGNIVDSTNGVTIQVRSQGRLLLKQFQGFWKGWRSSSGEGQLLAMRAIHSQVAGCRSPVHPWRQWMHADAVPQA